MRMTNKIMQNNSLYNINNNKILQDKLSTQMSTQKKITRPSDDPVIAIRALRLRSSVSELSQFYEKNAPDAESWLEVTGKALETVTDVLTDLSSKANKAANKDLKSEDLQIYVEQMKSLRNEFYSTGNVDYAGRYVFTGYRTDTTMSFTEEVEEMADGYPRYEITEQNTIGGFDTINYTNTAELDGLDRNNYDSADKKGVVEQDVINGDIHRMRLAYDDLYASDQQPAADVTIQVMDKDGTTVNTTILPTTVSTTTLPDGPYDQLLAANEAGKELTIFVPETGEVLFSDAAYANLETTINGIAGVDTEIRATYTKDEWRDGDLRPEHYFACKGTTLDKDGNEKTITYNEEYLQGEEESQVIEYDVGYNQSIRVNTTAKEVFTHNLDRDIDDLEKELEELLKIEKTQKELTTVLDGLEEGTAEYDQVKDQLDAANKAYSYIREGIHNTFEKTITKMQEHLDATNVAITDNGTRSQRLELISNRLMEQKTTFETLQSENEDADIAEVAVKLTSTELTYEAALMATGKIMQTSLMNYI